MKNANCERLHGIATLHLSGEIGEKLYNTPFTKRCQIFLQPNKRTNGHTSADMSRALNPVSRFENIYTVVPDRRSYS